MGVMKNLQLVTNLVGVPMYDDASWIIQVLLCDYLDMFSSLSLVQPPDDYVRNPVCVQRDDKIRQKMELATAHTILEFLSFWSL